MDYFFESFDDECFQILTDNYIIALAKRLREVRNRIQVLTIALSPECCGNWRNALHALKVFMEAYEEQRFEFPDDYQ